jgi:hypothetical protein
VEQEVGGSSPPNCTRRFQAREASPSTAPEA